METVSKRSRPPRSSRLLAEVRRARANAEEEPDPSAEQPFLRSTSRTRVRRVRRGRLGRAVLALELAGGLAAAVALTWVAYAKVMASERLRVSRLEVSGGRFLSQAQVSELLGPAVGENILNLDLEGLKARLEASPWVAEATVSRTLPDTLRVEVRERVPLAVAEVERLYLMAADGTLIDLYGPRTAGYDLPLVRGLGNASPEARRERGQRLAAFLDELAELSTEVSELEVVPSGEIRVVLRGRGETLRFDAPPFRPAFLTFLTLRAQLAERCPDAEYFDLRFRDRIYVKRGDGGSAEPVPGTAEVVPPEPGRAPASRTVPRPEAVPAGAAAPPAAWLVARVAAPEGR